MRAKVRQFIYQVRGSYWFIPALMALMAIVGSQVVVQLDHRLGADWMKDTWWISMNQPDGARSLLATVAGSMITVTGVTFSLTILAVSYATSHYGPRLLDNFMRDRGNQITLGTFVATFLYCLLVLRTVRSEAGDYAQWSASLFVPHLSIAVAIALTLASVGVLIYFIHHVPESIHISNVLGDISTTMDAKINELFPKSSEQKTNQTLAQVPDWEDSIKVHCRRSGYLQGIDETSLLSFTRRYNTVVKLDVQPGDYLLVGQSIATVKRPPPDRAAGDSDDSPPDPLEEEICSDRLHGAIAVGNSRTPTQDIFFLFNQYVEIAARALSPGVNDPFTAIECIDRIARGLAALSTHDMPCRYRRDRDDELRIIMLPLSWKGIVHAAFGQLIPYAEKDPNVRVYLRDRIATLLELSGNAGLNHELRNLHCE
ncbi:DUF2254 domain-containing protein [Stieleria sp. TO1_6]|uniref:DUF2254 domain-containing protein n=1 Tax=Stieleria tagensis TaxID=2956795 RepID=UPI00209AE42A|nr:DUF2254 domain-containing protein [Stieleria tagensis]MCO8124313.1 DUF2254 domain-containing protein [Stieleria tagensis]